MSKNPLVSIIIATYNSSQTIQDTLNSIKKQIYKKYEIIIIDKRSKDQTIEIIKKNNLKCKIFIGKDKGIYDAINKGIKKSKGEIISILHSNDYYFNKHVLKNVVKSFNKKNIDIVYGNLIYVKKDKSSIVRSWISSKFKKNLFLKAWSPPHPTFFCKKDVYKERGLYKQSIGNAADIELMYRFLEIYHVSSYYLNKNLVVMRHGGKSNKNIKTIIEQNLKILKFLKINKNFLSIFVFLINKFLDRAKQVSINKLKK